MISQEIVRLPEDWENVLIEQVAARRDIPERIQANIEEVGNPPTCRLKRYGELDQDLAKLRVFVNQLRRKIADDPAQPRYIVTMPGVGYRFRIDSG